MASADQFLDRVRNWRVTLRGGRTNFFLRFGFGHQRGKKSESTSGDRGQSKKTCSVSENLHHKPSEHVARSCAQPGRQGY